MNFKRRSKIPDSKFNRVQANIGKVHADKLSKFSKMYNLPVSRLIAIAIDNEIFDNDKPFKIDLSLPEDFQEYAFAEQAYQILVFLRTQKVGMSIDMLYVLRHDIGIADRETFLGAFKECLDKGMIEPVIAPKSIKYGNLERETTLYQATKIKIAGKDKEDLKKDARYEKYLKLKKEFDDN